MLLGTLGASLLGNMLTDKGIIRAGIGFKGLQSKGGKRNVRDFKIQKYYQNKPRFNGVCSRDNLYNEIKDEAYVMNFDEYSDIGTHWTALYSLNNNVTYFDSFGVEHIPKEIRKFIGIKNVQTNIFRIQAYDSVMCEYFCIKFIDFVLKDKSLTDFTNLFLPNNF